VGYMMRIEIYKQVENGISQLADPPAICYFDERKDLVTFSGANFQLKEPSKHTEACRDKATTNSGGCFCWMGGAIERATEADAGQSFPAEFAQFLDAFDRDVGGVPK